MFTTEFIEREQIKIIAAYDRNENNAIYDHFIKQQFIYIHMRASACFATYISKYVVKICDD